jgi:hypothetical protein
VPDLERASPVAVSLRDALVHGARLAFRTPSKPGDPLVTVGYDSRPSTSHLIWTWRFLRGFEAIGRAIEIYDLRIGER